MSSTIENNPRHWEAYRVYLLLRGGMALFFALVFTVNMVYFVTDLNLTPLQLVLVGTALETAVFVLEVPTGVVADVYSRRLSILIGLALLGVAFIIMGAVPTYAAVVLTQIIWGAGYTFTSGATEAWISDEVGEKRAGEVFMRGSQVGSIGSFIGIIGAVVLAAVFQLNAPMILGGVLFLVLAAVLAVIMPERGFQRVPAAERSSWSGVFDTFRDGTRLVRSKPVLIGILVLGVIYGIASEGYDRLWHKHLIDTITLPGAFPPIIWFGALDLAGIAIGLVMQEIVRRRVDFNSHRSVAVAAMLINLGIAGALLVVALAASLPVALAAILLIGPLRGTANPVFTAWINQSLNPKVRATVLSMSGQVDALGQVVGGPVVGLVGNVSVRAALALSALIWAAATPLYRRSLREQAVVPQPASD